MSRWRLLDAVLGCLTFCTCTHPGRRLTRPSVGLRGGPVRCLKIVTTSWVYRFSSRCSARSSRPTSQGGHLGPKGARAPRSRAFKVCSVRIYYKSQESAATYSCNKPTVRGIGLKRFSSLRCRTSDSANVDVKLSNSWNNCWLLITPLTVGPTS